MFLVISTASEGITGQNSYLCTTCLICYYASDYSVIVFNRNTAGGHPLIVKGPKEIKLKS